MTMNNKEKLRIITEYLDAHFPNAKCALSYNKDYELAIAVMLSAQTTDKAVNSLTPILFSKYDCLEKLANADVKDIENLIKKLGLYKNKAQNLVLFSQKLLFEYDGVLPSDKKILATFPGIGNKSAGVIRIEIFHIDDFPVDTHVTRISRRLKLATNSDTPDMIEQKLKRFFPQTSWIKLHHQFINFGRTICLAKKPKCELCAFKKICTEFN